MISFNWPGHVPSSEYNRTFMQGMLDRVAMSFSTYGKMSMAYPDKVNAIKTLKTKLAKYEETGNTEFLMDVANYAMIEFTHPGHPRAHYEPTPAKESAGRVWHGDARPIKKQNDDD